MLEDIYRDRRTCARLRSGPLGAHIDAFVAAELAQGYARLTIHDHLRVLGPLNVWLDYQEITASELAAAHLETFVLWRHRQRRPRREGRDVLARLLAHLQESGVAPAPIPLAPASPRERLLHEFTHALTHDRGYAASTVIRYVSFAREFLQARFGTGALRLRQLRAADIHAVVIQVARSQNRTHARNLVVALRAFLLWLQRRGDVAAHLAEAVPGVATWRLRDVPAVLTLAEVTRVLRTCDRRTAKGCRDYAILMLLARLGLRAGAVVALRLDDVDWRRGQLAVRRKGGRQDRLPLAPTVGAALAAYVQHVRPRCPERRLFLCLQAPHRGLGHSSTVSSIVAAAVRRADLTPTRCGAHLLRHTLASTLLRKGAPLSEIGQVLGHRSTAATEVYAKVDLAGLRVVTEPWPGDLR